MSGPFQATQEMLQGTRDALASSLQFQVWLEDIKETPEVEDDEMEHFSQGLTKFIEQAGLDQQMVGVA